jgi:beta-lactam-binding protein with PASTA domain
MRRFLLRWLVYLGYAGLLGGLFVITAYLSFSSFVRRGAMAAPDLVGLPLVDAGAMLDRAGLRMRRLEGEDRYDEKVPAGQSVRAAQAELAVSGLAMGSAARVFWAGGEPGAVVMQAPLAGAAVSPTTAVDVLVVSEDRASTFVMPDLVAQHAEPVRRYLEGRGFHFGSIKFEPYYGVEEGVILRHTPLAGYPLRRSDSITLVVATHQDG